MNVVATVVWNGHCQWSFVRTEKNVLQCWLLEGKAEPKKIYAWNLTLNAGYQDFLNFILQKFHMNDRMNLSEVVRTIIQVQNAFTMAQLNVQLPVESEVADG